MLTKSNFWRTAALVLLLLNVALLAFFLSRPRPPRGEGPKKIIIERLRFDDGQVAAYDKLIEQHKANLQTREAEIRTAKTQLYSLLQGDDLTQKDSLANRIGQLHVEVENIHFRHFQDLKNLCKPEQLADFKALAGELATYFAPPGRPPKRGPQ